ncbi:hypothetical protein PM082_006140 [Marasmius tenuissimus]|nr:hypothetical protein PM082_006140 [Marasmius tenuissimus]
MSHQPAAPFHPAEDGQRTIDGAELPRDVYSTSWRDHNVNNGPGTLTVNNDNRVIQQARSTYRHIRGTSEGEEAEYEEYGEYKRGDIQLLEKICHEEHVFGRKRGRYMECERSVFIGQVVAGDGRGVIVTVEAFKGRNAPEGWKESFAQHSGRSLCVNNAHLVALNRSKVPLLIFSAGLIPIAHLRNSGKLAEIHLYNLIKHAHCLSSELWLDPTRGVFCRGPEGPYPNIGWRKKWVEVESLPLATDLIQEDVFLRFLGSQRSKAIDDAVVEAIYRSHIRNPLPHSFMQPVIFSTLTQTPIAFANNLWSSDFWNLVEKKLLGDVLVRFRLNEDAIIVGDSFNPYAYKLKLALNGGFWNEASEDPGKDNVPVPENPARAWILQASRIFHSRGIESLEGDPSVYQLVYRGGQLSGCLHTSPSKSQRRRRQPPIYLFVTPPASLNDGWTSSLHFWSFREDGWSPRSPESCNKFGLPTKLFFENDGPHSFSWPNNSYKGLCEYQISRGYDPKTLDFARHLGFDQFVFWDTDDSGQFEEVLEVY